MRNLDNVHTIVVKVGTNLLTCPSGIDEKRIDGIVDQIAQLKKKGYQVLLVSSGAIGMGTKELGIGHKVQQIAMRQACASIGQPILMSSYRASFSRHGIICSQVLLTREELNNRRTYVNLRNSIGTLLELGVVPVFNENDAVSTVEIGSAFGDNDRMAAMIASKVDAQLLVILSDIPGLYTADPKKDPDAKFLSEIEKVDDTVLSYAGGAGSSLGTGGMKSKLLAARIAAIAGCASVIASGYESDALLRIVAGESLGSYIAPEGKLRQRSRWILNNSHKGSITVDDGAFKALKTHKSLLPKGVTGVEGTFDKGDVVQIKDSAGRAFAKAVVYYSSTEIAVAAGHRSSELSEILGPDCKDVLFRPEDLVFLEEK
ncbi:MAG: glutamate 5-kinase [Sphaerochaetaceae bacterium]|jgi:glutamate 5-kinase|nr:glutamate 5-kinase [Sphaerochaetaceae bacterium]MDD3163909.1 glutamate 5-kinase [Sphaerochaetaceae bacterium]MDD4007176.1 glutamate 5-kinase [Sphaerochaetaceae bacterium]MDD4396731.1 glutamate 5-kinase [Sphaerochaetaceae bacterium]